MRVPASGARKAAPESRLPITPKIRAEPFLAHAGTEAGATCKVAPASVPASGVSKTNHANRTSQAR
jgi:hypothetical protein